MENEILFRLIANPNKLKKKRDNVNTFDYELLEILKKKYDRYEITNDSFEKIKKGIEDILINQEINLIIDDIINEIPIKNE